MPSSKANDVFSVSKKRLISSESTTGPNIDHSLTVSLFNLNSVVAISPSFIDFNSGVSQSVGWIGVWYMARIRTFRSFRLYPE